MKKSKLVLSTVLAATMLMSAAPAVHADEAEGGSDLVIGFSDMILGTNVWFQEVEAGVENLLDQYVADGTIKEYYMTNADGDLIKQQQDIRDLITKGVDAIVYCPLSSDGLNGVLQEAYDAGILLVCWGQECSFEHNLTFVGTDDRYIGADLGKFAGEHTPEGGKVIELAGMVGITPAEHRKEAAEAAFYEANPTAEIVAVGYGEYEYGTSKVAFEDLLAANPDFDGILSLSGVQSQAIIDVLTERGMEVPPLAGEPTNGYLKTAIDMMNSGSDWDSIAVVSPTRQGATAVEIAVGYLQEGKIPDKFEVDEETGYVWDRVEPVPAEQYEEIYRPDLIEAFYAYGHVIPEEILEERFSN